MKKQPMTKEERLRRYCSKFTIGVGVLAERGTYEGSYTVFEMPYGHRELKREGEQKERWEAARKRLKRQIEQAASIVVSREEG